MKKRKQMWIGLRLEMSFSPSDDSHRPSERSLDSTGGLKWALQSFFYDSWWEIKYLAFWA